MRKLSGLLLVGALMLTGCAATPSAQPPTAVTETAATATTFEDIATLDDALAHVRSISASTSDLAAEVSGTAQKLGDLVVAAELPWDVNNKVGGELISLNSAVRNAPADAASQISELNRIADEIEAVR